MCLPFASISQPSARGWLGGCRAWLALVVLLLGQGAAQATGPLYEVAPDNIESRVKPINSSKPQIKGVLPKGWVEDSAWADVEMEYTVEKGLPGQPKAYLRARIDKCTRGQAQIKLPFAGKPAQQQYLKFTMRARSITGNTIRLMVRQHEAPYKAHWQHTVKLDTIWRDYDFDVEINAPDEKLAALIDLGKGGKTDIARFVLSQQTRDEVIAARKKEFPDGGPKNVLSHSRLPAGVPSGWTYAAESSLEDELVIRPDPGKEGPAELPKVNGVSPLKISTRFTMPMEGGDPVPRDAALSLCTQQITLAAPYEPHTVSLYVSGSLDKGQLTVFEDGQSIKDNWFSVKPDDGWKRISFSFTPKLLARHYVLRLEGRGEFWVDGWQINRGDKPTPLEPSSPAEVTLSFGNQSRVVFAGEEVPLRATVLMHTPTKGATLVAERLDAYGKVRALRSEQIDSPDVTRLLLREKKENLGQEPALGPVLVSAWLEVGGKRISAKEELIYNVVPKPAAWGKDAPGSFFGAHLPPTRRHIEMAKSIGIDWVRMPDDSKDATAWAAVEPEKGVWNFPDRWVDRYRAGNLLILGRLSTTPAWAREGEYRENSHTMDLYFRSKNPKDFANYADRVVEHFRGRIAAWDVWKRPWDRLHVSFNKDKKDWNERYVQGGDNMRVFAQYSDFAAASIARYDPQAILVGIGGNYRGRGERWMEESVKAGLVEPAGALGFYAYWSVDRGNLVDPASNFSTLMNRNILAPLLKVYPQVPRPLWMTEASFSLGPFEQGLHGWSRQVETHNRVLLWTLADRAVRFCVAAQAQGVEKVFFYSMDYGDSPSWGARASLVGEDSYLAPSGVALAVFAKQTEGRKLLKRVEVSPGIFAAFYQGGGRTLAVVIPPEGEQVPGLPKLEGVKARDIFGNPREATKGRMPDGSLYLETDMPVAQLEAKLKEVLPPFPEKKA